MAQIYQKQDILHVLKGATFLGAGGGGSFQYGVKLLEQLERMHYDVQFNLLSVEEMKKGQYAGMVAALGQPTAIDPIKLADDLPAAFTALKIACSADGRDLQYLYSGEMGGFNTMVPIFLSIVSNQDPTKRIPVLDVDCNGRAVPELGTCLASARGIPPCPLGMAGHKADEAQYRYISWPRDADAAEALARKLGGSWYDLIGFSTWAMSQEELKTNAGVNYISYARRIGEALENKEMPLYDALHSVMPRVKELFNGTIEAIINDGGSGFDQGRIIIGAPKTTSKKICIQFQNESLVVGNYENEKITEVYLTAPELISMVDADTRQPLTNDNDKDIRVGQNVTVFLSPAHYFWWDDKKAYECFRPVLRANGYEGEFVCYSPFFEDNKVDDFSFTMALQLAYASENPKLQFGLEQYLQNNLFADQPYVDRFIATAFADKEAPKQREEPTITERTIALNGPPLLSLTKERYDPEQGFAWAGHYLPRFGDDKTLRALREGSSRPIFDAFDPAILLSLALAEQVCVLTWPDTMLPIIQRKISAAGFDARISVRSVNPDPSKLLHSLLVEGIAAIKEGAQALIIGRSYWTDDAGREMDYALAQQVQEKFAQTPELAVPVLDPNRVGARWLEMCVHMGYFHSRRSYMTPPAKNV